MCEMLTIPEELFSPEIQGLYDIAFCKNVFEVFLQSAWVQPCRGGQGERVRAPDRQEEDIIQAAGGQKDSDNSRLFPLQSL